MARQEKIPGTERTKHADVESAADRYVGIRDERMELTERETNAKGELLAAMNKHGLESYSLDDGRVVTVIQGDAKVSVRKPQKPKEDEAA